MTLLKKICPICALVLLTWVTMLVFRWQGFPVNSELIAMLMGGSAVGVSSVLGVRLHSTVQTMYWKLISIPLGFATLYALLQFAWGYVLGGLITYALVLAIFQLIGPKQKNEHDIEGITKKLDSCCQ